MSTLKKYDLKGCELGQIEIDEKLAGAEAHGQMVKDYIVAIRENARQWSANTKGRSEVSHSTKKPHPQKGGGRARQGSLVAPQYKGGGRVFGPKPKFDQHVRINKKERQAAIRSLLGEKVRNNKLHVVENFDLEQPRTKDVAAFLKGTGLTGRVLFLGEATFEEIWVEDVLACKTSISSDKHNNFVKSLRNIPKMTFTLATNISGYDVLIANHIVVTETALKQLNEWLC